MSEVDGGEEGSVYEPPPIGVSGWGALRTAKPGVKIWPLEMVKFHSAVALGMRADMANASSADLTAMIKI